MASLTTETSSTTAWSEQLTSIDAQIKENRRLAAEADLDTTPESDDVEDNCRKEIRRLKKEKSDIGTKIDEAIRSRYNEIRRMNELQLEFKFAKTENESTGTGETKEEVVVDSCPEGALRVKAGLNSFSKAVKDAKEQKIKDIFLESGMHDEGGEEVVIDFALNVVGENKVDVKIRAGLVIRGKKEEDVSFSNCTVTGAKETGVYGNEGAAMHLKNVCIEKCGAFGVYVHVTKRNTMTDCNVNNNKESGVKVEGGGRMIIDGSATTIHHNVTGGYSDEYGLAAANIGSSSSIHLKSPLTLESISTNNGGGGNYGGDGTIAIVDNEGTVIETIQEANDY